jgi:hypothetical protein
MKTLIWSTLLLIALMVGVFCVAQQRSYTYGISMNGKPVGELKVIQKAMNDSLVIDITSVIMTRMIFLFKVVSFDKTIFHHGRLHYSSTFRQINKGHKSTTVTRDMGQGYHSEKEGNIKEFPRSCIYHNMSSLYISEPTDFTVVYSDVFQQFVGISYVEPHRYKLKLPDGNTNEYYYANGICKRIRVNHTMFSAQMDLKAINNL